MTEHSPVAVPQGRTSRSAREVRASATAVADARGQSGPGAPIAPGSAMAPPRIARRDARAARRHSIFVAVMKGMLPSLLIGMVLALVLWSQGVFEDTASDAAFEPGEIDLSGSGVKMLAPKLTGLDRDDQRFEVTAQSATQDADDPGLVTMHRIRARMALQDGGWFRVEAEGGEYDSNANILTLRSNIEVTVSSGYVARLNDARVDFQEGRVDTANPVLVFMNAGIITGNAMTMFEKGKRVRFSGGATMTINGRAGSTAARQ